MTRSKRTTGTVLPPVDASPEEIAQAIFEFNPNAAPLGEGHTQAPEPPPDGELSIKVQEGSPTHRWYEEQEAGAQLREAEQST